MANTIDTNSIRILSYVKSQDIFAKYDPVDAKLSRTASMIKDHMSKTTGMNGEVTEGKLNELVSSGMLIETTTPIISEQTIYNITSLGESTISTSEVKNNK